MTPLEAWWYARNNYTKPNFDLNKYKEIACTQSEFAYYFARDIPGADIEYCQEHVCKNLAYAYLFAKDIPGANIEYCRKVCEHDKFWLNKFDKMIIEKAMI